MPQPKRSPGQTTVSRNGGAPDADLNVEQAAQIRAGMGAKEQAPSTRVSSVFQNWRDVADQLGDPFEREKIPISKLRQMRRDPMLGFGLSFIKVPHVRANWYINARSNSGPNLQVANHLDYDLRRIYASLNFQLLNSLDFGFQAIAKRFEFHTPPGTFVDIDPTSGEEIERPIWDQGSVQPIAWKPFVPLRPEGVEPIWNPAGEFDGIEYAPTGTNTGQAQQGQGSGAGQTSGGKGGTNKEETYKIDLAHSLWMTNEMDSNFRSIFGYPRLGYAYSYWWSYWFRWAIADRAFERKADPSVLVYHPDGEFVNEDTGERMSYSEYAILMGERMRSGGVIALPSTVYEDANGRGTIREWEIDFTKDAVNFEPFDASFEYMDVQKLRALFIPEQAFLEGKGGTSSRNVADTMGSAFIEAQDALSKQLIDHINRWIIPQWVAANYPEFLADNGVAELMVQGFGDEDYDFMVQLIQLIGQQQSGQQEIMSLVDIKKILEDRGVPLTTFAQQQRIQQELIAQQQALTGPTAPTLPGPLGAPPAPGTSVAPAPAAPTGFAYVPNYGPGGIVTLADNGTDFILNLPGTPHYADNAVKGFARVLWNLYRDLYRDEYETAAAAIASAQSVADSDNAQRAQKLLSRWVGSQRWDATLVRSRELFENIIKRAVRVELARLRKPEKVSAGQMEGWISGHLADMLAKAAETTRAEVRRFVEGQIDAGVVTPLDLASAVREHFADFPQWKSDRLVRTEVRDLYNAGTLMAASSNGIERVMALDNQGPQSLIGDPECMNRHGQIFDTEKAWDETDHPNGTLGWRLVPDGLKIVFGDVEGAEFDEESAQLTLSESLDDRTLGRIVVETVEFLTT
jgi:hypothetical protein